MQLSQGVDGSYVLDRYLAVFCQAPAALCAAASVAGRWRRRLHGHGRDGGLRHSRGRRARAIVQVGKALLPQTAPITIVSCHCSETLLKPFCNFGRHSLHMQHLLRSFYNMAGSGCQTLLVS